MNINILHYEPSNKKHEENMNILKKTIIATVASTMLITPQTVSAQPLNETVGITSTITNTQKSQELNSVNVTYQAQGYTQTASGRNYSKDGATPKLPYANGNPYGIKQGDTLQLSNFRRPDFPICFVGFSCLFKPNYTLKVTSVTETKQGTRFTLNGFGGYDGHPVFKNGQLIGVVKGSNGGNAYGYLFPTEDEAMSQRVNYKPLKTGLFTRAAHGSDAHPFSSKQGSSSRNSSSAQDIVRVGTSSQEGGLSSDPHYVKGGVDPAEGVYISAHPESWEKNGSIYLESVKWNASTKSFVINPRSKYTTSNPFLGLSSLSTLSSQKDGDIPITKMWQEAVSLGVPNIKSIEQQFRCHAQGSAIKKSGWNLEMGRPATQDQAYYNRFACNPPRP